MKSTRIFFVIFIIVALSFSMSLAQDTFLPLQIGNKWFYSSIPEMYAISVVDTVTLQNHQYFELDWWDQRFIRLDSLNRMIELMNDKEQVLLDFRIQTGDTIYNYEKGYATCISRDSVETFTGGRDIQIAFHTNRDTTMSEQEWIVTLEKNIGIVEDNSPSLNKGVLAGMILNGKKYGETGVNQSLALQSRKNVVIENCSPNPFNSSTIIQYKVLSPSYIKIHVYNAIGVEMAVLEDAVKSAGSYSLRWNPEHMSTGVYYIKISVDDVAFIQKILYLK